MSVRDHQEHGPPEVGGAATRTAEGLSHCNGTAARRLDQRIRLLVGSIGDNLAKLHALVQEAKQGEIHEELGFPSWTAYLADALTIQVQLGREQRRELVGYLSGEGMSQRAISSVVGVDQKTISNDLRAGEENSSPQPVSANAVVTGLDGKTYQPKPAQPAKPRRGSIVDDFGRAASDLGRVTNRLEKLADDDRFKRNLEAIGYRVRPEVGRGLKILDRLAEQIHSSNDPNDFVGRAARMLQAIAGGLALIDPADVINHPHTVQHIATILDSVDSIHDSIKRIGGAS
jgi:hypothetical protein